MTGALDVFDPCYSPQPPDVFTFATYKAFLNDSLQTFDQPGRLQQDLETLARYRSRLPVCLLARCPVCACAIAEPIDIFSLNGFGWKAANAGLGWSQSMGQRAKEFHYCEHLKIISFFLNLNGRVPDDLFPGKSISAGPEVPSVMRVPMRSEKTTIVMHALPVGRFDDVVWQPRYTVYFLSYFTSDPADFARATAHWGLHYGLAEYQDVDDDLAAWAARRRLLWLDTTVPQCPLVSTETGRFPYGNITGDRRPFRTLTRTGVTVPKPGLLSRLTSRLAGLFRSRD